MGRRCVETVVLGVHVCTDLQQQHARLNVSHGCSDVNGRLLPVVADVNVGPPLHEPTDAINVVVSRRDVEGREAIFVARVDLNPVGVQEFHHVIALVASHDVEWCISLASSSFQLRAAPIAELRETSVTCVASILQQSLVRFDIECIHLRGFKQPLQHVHQNSAVPGHDLLQVEGFELFLRWVKRTLQISKGVFQRRGLSLFQGHLRWTLAHTSCRCCGLGMHGA
mmetsp:Transcript_54147/g.115589  ORF Transcript_54147/g.115589 Transcript_54147/m.115589 type:complete len:225 (-) Transcript_54147:770-1444(-)